VGLHINEVGAETAEWFLNLNATHFEDPITETPQVGTIEDWVYINLTGDTHPLHNHLVQFQVVGRTPFDAEAYEEAYGGPNGVPGGIDPTPFATGPMDPPDPTERGFKDTVKANPGQFTTIRAKYDLPTGVTAPQAYVYHCPHPRTRGERHDAAIYGYALTIRLVGDLRRLAQLPREIHVDLAILIA
jgi:FtsP/CotA-like multicopper oxidase with cupredoxin domain